MLMLRKVSRQNLLGRRPVCRVCDGVLTLQIPACREVKRERGACRW